MDYQAECERLQLEVDTAKEQLLVLQKQITNHFNTLEKIFPNVGYQYIPPSMWGYIRNLKIDMGL